MTPQYQDHIPLITKVLGRQAMLNGDGHEPFLHAVRTHDAAKGKFSTWLYHNLNLVRLQTGNKLKKHPHPNQFIEIDEALGLNGVLDPHERVEFKSELNSLSEDAKAIIRCLFQEMNSVSKRTRWPESSVCNKSEIKRHLKGYCRETLMWSWPRYWSAVHEIEEILK